MALDASGRPTYQDVIDQLSSEFPLESFNYTPAMLMDWIRQAEQEITDRIVITETYNLTIAADDTEYDFGYFTSADATKIPMRFYDIFKIERNEDDRYFQTKIVSNSEFVDQKIRDFFIADTSFDIPCIATIEGSTMGKRVLRIWQEPDESKTLTIHGRVKIYPNHYASDTVTTAIQLSEEYVPMIREIVIAKAVRSTDKEEFILRRNEFERLVRQRIATSPRPIKMKVLYR